MSWEVFYKFEQIMKGKACLPWEKGNVLLRSFKEINTFSALMKHECSLLNVATSTAL